MYDDVKNVHLLATMFIFHSQSPTMDVAGLSNQLPGFVQLTVSERLLSALSTRNVKYKLEGFNFRPGFSPGLIVCVCVSDFSLRRQCVVCNPTNVPRGRVPPKAPKDAGGALPRLHLHLQGRGIAYSHLCPSVWNTY